MQAMVTLKGDHAVIHSGRVPVMTRARRQYRMSTRPVARAAVSEMARCLLPKDEIRALDEIGETRYHLPHSLGMGADDFVVDITDREGEICIDIEHRRVPEADEVPDELFTPVRR